MDQNKQILVEHYRESQKRMSSLHSWSLMGAGSWAALALFSESGTGGSLPGGLINLNGDSALWVAAAVFWFAGAMASYAAEAAERVVTALRINGDSDLVQVLQTYPSITNEPYPLVKLGAIWSPAVLFAAGLIGLAARSDSDPEWAGLAALVALGSLPAVATTAITWRSGP